MTYSCMPILRYILFGILSNFGTLILIVLYLIGGGFLFVLLESQNEIKSCYTSYGLLTEKLNDTTLRGMTIGLAGYNVTEYYAKLYEMLLNYTKDVYTLGISPTKDCKTLGQANNLPNWNLANAIFFCATIVTTIGYGNITPATMWGRIVCVIYAFIGIPLMLLFLGNFGEILADAFRAVYINLCCCKCFLRNRLKKAQSPNKRSAIDITNYEIMKESDDCHAPMRSLGPAKTMIDKEHSVEVIEVNDENYENEDNGVINIPLTVVTGFLLFYMYLGAILFRIWETWDLVAAIYFSFITVSTIGFGDLYPAKETIGTSSATIELLVAAAYLVVGLAVLSMSLNLVKDEIIDKVLWMGSKLGLLFNRQPENNETKDFNNFEDNSKIEYPALNSSARFGNEAFEYSGNVNGTASNLKIKSA